MIFVDANYFLRYLVTPKDPALRSMADQARRLFEAVERGDEVITTTEVVLHEVCYILESKAHYGLDASFITSAMAALLRLPGFHLPAGEKRRYLRAFELWARHPVLGFSDAIIAARVEEMGVPLASFDRHFDRLGITRWRSAASS